MNLNHFDRKRMISYILILLFSLISVFHILVLTQIIPYGIVWGGKLKSLEEMYRFEIVSLLLNSFFLAVVLVKVKILKLKVPEKILNIILWVMAVLFALNTVGNLFAEDPLERNLFTPATLFLSLSCGFLAWQKNEGD